jgi:DNA repair photolyase
MQEKIKEIKMKKPKVISGTLEWAVKNVNCIKGCSHQCKYCYARERALRFRQIGSKDEWKSPQVREKEVKKSRKKESGTVMFPTTHDIFPEMLDPCVTVIRKLLEAGNDVLIVSKPHLECIKRLCQEFTEYKSKILFRFTIGASDDNILKYWEPGAPIFSERIQSLQWAFSSGFKTSVSCEPMLDAEHMVELFATVCY